MVDEYPDPPPGWIELQERMKRAQTGDEVDQIAGEMKKLIDVYEAKTSSRSLSPPPADDSDQPRQRKH